MWWWVGACVNINRRTTHRTQDRTRGRGTHRHRRDAGLEAGALIDRVERAGGAHVGTGTAGRGAGIHRRKKTPVSTLVTRTLV